MDLILGYAAGLLTLINPCVLPVLPIVLASALQASRLGPVALAAGLSVAFTTFGLTFAWAGRSLGFDADMLARIAALVMVGFGLVLLVPKANRGFALATAGLASRADRGIARIDTGGAPGQFFGGLLLGAVWSPCVGPTLGGAIALASQGQSLTRAGATMFSFALGVSTVILALSYGARSALKRRQALMRGLASRAKPIMGAVFVLTGLALYFQLQHFAEAWLVSITPNWLQDLSVSL